MDKNSIFKILENIPDPEIPVVNIVELGMIKDVLVNDNNEIVVQIMPTYTACPATWQIQNDIQKKLSENNLNAKVEIVYSPAWTTDRITPEASEKLKKYGIAPPQKNGTIHQLTEQSVVIPCPHCGSTNTKLVSPFGSTPCKALMQCNDCLEPFDYFKCHL
ncbi:MAG: phenylacetate-CoA oxygenase subunit PaaJ [Bacteroidia bacterium]|nr:MAG: phenylacetate-CoA oxygenase subunit PaaJ [Bacteroidia bacterium]